MASLQDANPLSSADLKRVYGNPGTESYGGFFQEEPNAAWRDEARVDNVELMRRTDGTVKATLNALKAPVLATKWKIESPDETPKGLEIKTQCEDLVFNMRGRTWNDFLREALTFLDFGFSVFELIWDVVDGKLMIVDVEPRIQHSIYKWEIEGGAQGVTQLILNDKTTSTNAEIPMEKLLVFTNDKEGDDITGQSILRAAWKHFYAKDKLYRIGLIASERHGIGVPKLTLPGTQGADELAAAETLLRNYRSNEQGFVVLPSKEWEMEIMSLGGNSQSGIIEQQIEHHDKMILRTALMGFIGLASGDGGSMALSKDQSSYALKIVEDKANYLAEQFTRQVLHRYIFMAYPAEYERMKAERMLPYLSFEALGDVDFTEYANVMNTLKGADLLHVNSELKQFTHSFFKLPEISESDMEAMKAQEQEVDSVQPDSEPNGETQSDEGEEQDDQALLDELDVLDAELAEEGKKKIFKPWRELTFAEGRVRFATISSYLDEHEEKVTETLDGFIWEQESAFLDKVQKLIEAKDIAGIAALTLVGLAALKTKLKEEVKNAMEVGKSQAAGELQKEVPSTPSLQNKITNAQIDQMADEYEMGIVSEAKKKAMQAVASGIGVTAAVHAVKVVFEKVATAQNLSITSNLSGTALNIGRSLVFDHNRADLYALQRSEILDDRTCAVCLSIDSRIVDNQSPFAKLGQVHNNCRGMWVPILLTDPILPKITDVPKTIKSRFETTEGVPSVNNFVQMKAPIFKKDSRVAEAEAVGKLG